MRDGQRMDFGLHFLSAPKEGHSLWTAEPLVTVGDEEVATKLRELSHVQLNVANRVCPIHKSHDPAATHETTSVRGTVVNVREDILGLAERKDALDRELGGGG
jgi:hypothetical protein